MWIAKIINNFLSFVFPTKCFICGRSEIILCNECLKNFSHAVDTPYLWIYVNYSFKDKNIKKIIHAIKYYHRKDLIEPLVSSVITKKFKEHIEQFENPVFIPIPMNTFRRHLRGYNHAELIAKEFSKQLNIPMYNDVLVKSKSTKQQAKIKSHDNRFKNIKNSFKIINEEKIFNRHIILIDDVTTTGATLYSARETFLKNNFKNISAVCLAH